MTEHDISGLLAEVTPHERREPESFRSAESVNRENVTGSNALQRIRMIQTTIGLVDETTLARTVGLEDRPASRVLWIEWRSGETLVKRETYALLKDVGPTVFTTKGDIAVARLVTTLELTDAEGEYVVAVVRTLDGELVKRDVHVVLKHPSVTATALVGGF